MALQIWVPLGNSLNQGISNVTVTNNGATILNDGIVGQCYNFGDGTDSTKSKGININNNLSFLGNNRSICAWVRPKGNHLHYSGAIASSGNWNNSTRWGFCLKQDNTGFTGFDSGFNTYYNTNIPTNTWTHLCVTVDGDNGITKFYKNGNVMKHKFVKLVSQILFLLYVVVVIILVLGMETLDMFQKTVSKLYMTLKQKSVYIVSYLVMTEHHLLQRMKIN